MFGDNAVVCRFHFAPDAGAGDNLQRGVLLALESFFIFKSAFATMGSMGSMGSMGAMDLFLTAQMRLYARQDGRVLYATAGKSRSGS